MYEVKQLICPSDMCIDLQYVNYGPHFSSYRSRPFKRELQLSLQLSFMLNYVMNIFTWKGSSLSVNIKEQSKDNGAADKLR